MAGSEAEAVREARAQGIRPGALSALLEELVQAPGGASSQWDRALRPGAVIGRFELVRELGRGGFGVVYEARDRELGRAVAFKAIVGGERPDVGEERLLAEADAAARLSHPNIVTLYDAGRSEHGPFLVLELLRGRTLAARLTAGRLGVRETLRVAVAVARGIAHAHARGVVHRDLTPGNVFLCDDGQVKVLDLGMAHAFGRRKIRGGTPAYVAPEGWRGAPEDERSDVYGLGVVLYECLTGELPHAADEGRSAAGRPAPALEVAAAPALGDLVARMVAPDPVDRPRDGAEVLAALLA
ncbi:MAG: serine/threonine-protein kinase, partial [Anaeromyxobacteraceae bacterium]